MWREIYNVEQICVTECTGTLCSGNTSVHFCVIVIDVLHCHILWSELFLYRPYINRPGYDILTQYKCLHPGRRGLHRKCGSSHVTRQMLPSCLLEEKTWFLENIDRRLLTPGRLTGLSGAFNHISRFKAQEKVKNEIHVQIELVLDMIWMFLIGNMIPESLYRSQNHT